MKFYWPPDETEPEPIEIPLWIQVVGTCAMIATLILWA